MGRHSGMGKVLGAYADDLGGDAAGGVGSALSARAAGVTVALAKAARP